MTPPNFSGWFPFSTHMGTIQKNRVDGILYMNKKGNDQEGGADYGNKRQKTSDAWFDTDSPWGDDGMRRRQ
ncbi:hypothetical protein CXIVA_18910 [Clostridium sp. SY8519]|nr:hypothetical protein CXIVA_18910 [Clostridium sp. SY8519]